jgi:uncharacterized protein YceK
MTTRTMKLIPILILAVLLSGCSSMGCLKQIGTDHPSAACQ